MSYGWDVDTGTWITTLIAPFTDDAIEACGDAVDVLSNDDWAIGMASDSVNAVNHIVLWAQRAMTIVRPDLYDVTLAVGDERHYESKS